MGVAEFLCRTLVMTNDLAGAGAAFFPLLKKAASRKIRQLIYIIFLD